MAARKALVVGPQGLIEPLRAGDSLNGAGGGVILRATWHKPGGIITTPVADIPHYVPGALTILKAAILTQGGIGGCVIDIRKAPIAVYPPGPGNSICGAAKPTVTAGRTYQDAMLTGWDTAIAADDILSFVLESTTTFTAITLFLILE